MAASLNDAVAPRAVRSIRRVLIVEDEPTLCRALGRLVESFGATFHHVGTLIDGVEALDEGWDLVLLDVGLPDGSGVLLAEECAKLSPAPLVVALSGAASPAEGFWLARAGVHDFVLKPYTVSDVRRAIFAALCRAPEIVSVVRSCVGVTELPKVEESVRRTMIEQALSLTQGNRTDAASLLGISRQALQYILRRNEMAKKTVRSSAPPTSLPHGDHDKLDDDGNDAGTIESEVRPTTSRPPTG